jgi:hypothetical protein
MFEIRNRVSVFKHSTKVSKERADCGGWGIMTHSLRDFVRLVIDRNCFDGRTCPVEPEFVAEASASKKLQLHPLTPVPINRVTIAE